MKRMNKNVLVFTVVLILAMSVGVQFVAVTAAKKTTVTYGVTPVGGNGYKLIVGELGGAKYAIYIPDPVENWNGKLIVYGHSWFSGVEPDVSRFNLPAYSRGIDRGCAFAASTFGEGGYPMQKAVIRTHQLTEYVVENYNVEGKIFLLGSSMGAVVVLLTGAKYPELYSGVVDINGAKDLKESYARGSWADLDDDDLIAALGASGPDDSTLIIRTGGRSLQSYRDLVRGRARDIANECGGTPEEKPKAYDRVSPLYSATDLKIPVITIHGTLDEVVSISQSYAYKDAVAEAGHSDLHRLVVVEGGGHGTSSVRAQVNPALDELSAWSDILDPQ